MTGIRVALAQLNPTVGDISGNCDQVMAAAEAAHAAGANLLATPEMMIPGYPVEDLALRTSFARASMTATTELAARLAEAGLGGLTVVVGTLALTDLQEDRFGDYGYAPTNAAWVLADGEVLARYNKHHLPNYGVFDEFRYFVPGRTPCIVDVAGTRVSLAICEDLWQDGGPVEWTQAAGADLLLVLNGSPFEEDKEDTRLELCSRRARQAGCPLAYVNMFGGQDELVFGGDSLIVDAQGELVMRGEQFAADLLVADIAPEPLPLRPKGSHPARASDTELVYRALTTGVHDYVAKNGFESVVLGLSGGIDSALVAAISCDALGPDRVLGISMPSQYSSDHSQHDAADLADRTGIGFRSVPIEPMVTAFRDPLELTGLAEENLQARVRGVTLMALSNAEGHLVLATGNKTEIAVGYSTIYGDAVGGFAPIKDVAKTQVWELARWRNQFAQANGETPPIPPSSVEKPPSAELRPDQLDSDSLPDYKMLDLVLDAYVERDHGADQLAELGFESTLIQEIIRMTDAAEYKRRQYPPGTKITLKAFGRDRRLPITNRWREH